MVYDLVNALSSAGETENDLRSFKAYLEEQREDPATTLGQAISGVQYTYDTDLLVYTETVDGAILQSDSEKLMEDLLLEYFSVDMAAMSDLQESYGMGAFSMGSSMTLWQEMLPGVTASR